MLDIGAASCAHVPVHAYSDWMPNFDPPKLPDPLADLKSDTVTYTPITNPDAPPVDNPSDLSFSQAQARIMTI